MTSRAEQETTVTFGASEDVVRIFTTVPKHMRKLEADGRVTALGNGFYEVSVRDFDPLRGFGRRRKPLTDEQREAATLRLRGARIARGIA